ncbi:MAG: hypothetical protein ABIP75_08560 [Pyrinomonadaceae bacterium]
MRYHKGLFLQPRSSVRLKIERGRRYRREDAPQILSQGTREGNDFVTASEIPTHRRDIDRKAVTATKRRIEITVEKHRRIVLSQRNRAVNAWCHRCAGQVQMVTPDEVAQLCDVSTRTVYRWIEMDRVHFTETDKGFSLICLFSLDAKMDPMPGDEKSETGGAPGFFRKGLMKRVLKRH